MKINQQTKEVKHKTELAEMWCLLKRAGGHIAKLNPDNHTHKLGGREITKIYYDKLDGDFKQ